MQNGKRLSGTNRRWGVKMVDTVWQMTMDYIDRLHIVNGHKWTKYFLASVGAHIANYYNKGGFRIAFYTQFGNIPDLRLHLFLVAPPGYGKTLMLRLFLEERLGLLIRAIQCMMEGKITEKGLIGGYDDKGLRVVGEAERYSLGILGFDEFAHVISASEQEHSSNLLNTMLNLLDSGYVRYRSGSHDPVEFTSFMTLWAGTQSERFNLESGLARRLLFLDMTPGKEEVAAYAQAQRDGLGVAPDFAAIDKIRAGVRKIKDEWNVSHIEFSDDYISFRNRVNDHLEMAFLDKLAIGYNVIRNNACNDNLYIEIDQELKVMFVESLEMKMQCLNGVGMGVILKLLQAGPLSLTKLKTVLTRRLSIDYKLSESILSDLQKRGRITIEKRAVPGVKKLVQFVELVPNDEIVETALALEVKQHGKSAFTLD